MIRVAVLTISDRGARGERDDKSGAAVKAMIAGLHTELVSYDVVPDDKDAISGKLAELADSLGAHLIITTGGTGVSPRDVTPEATRAVIDRELPGMAEAMRAESMKKTPNAMLSRAVCGIRGMTLIVNLPGSPRAVRENLAVVLPSIEHAVEKICGSDAECGAG
jgi:molybdopterin adenylyltransferase